QSQRHQSRRLFSNAHSSKIRNPRRQTISSPRHKKTAPAPKRRPPILFLSFLELEPQSEFHIAVIASAQAVRRPVEPPELLVQGLTNLRLQALHKEFAEVHVVKHVIRRRAEN